MGKYHILVKGQDLPPECLSGTMISLRLAPWLWRRIDKEVYVLPLTSHSHNEAHTSIKTSDYLPDPCIDLTILEHLYQQNCVLPTYIVSICNSAILNNLNRSSAV